MTNHALLAPSAAHRWVKCALAPTLEQQYPEAEDSPASLEGTAAHWVVQQYLEGAGPAIGTMAPNGVCVTVEMIEGAEMVLDEMARVLGPDYRSLLVVEEQVAMPRIHPTANWGTPDFRAWYTHASGHLALFVADYKFGHGLVEVFENWQLLDYAAGILEEVSPNGLEDQKILITFCVIQPRGYHRDGPVRHWKVWASELRGYFNRLERAAGLATSGTPRANPDPGACKDCSGRHACEALQRAGYDAIDTSQALGAVDLPAAALGLELRLLTRAAKLLQARISGLETQVEAEIRGGKIIPFWVLENKKSPLSWAVSSAEAIALGQAIGIDLAKPIDAITPTQAKTKGLPEALLEVYAKRTPAGYALKFDDGSKARLTFSSSGA